LPSVNRSYTHAYVLGTGGPNLSNISTFTMNWDLANKGLYQFSANTTNGAPNWYVDLRIGTVQTLSSAQPSITLSGTGFTGLDGSYYVGLFNTTDFVMVSKTAPFTIYFSNSSTAPVCTKSAPSVSQTEEASIKVFPNPFAEAINVQLTDPNDVSAIYVLDELGRVRIRLEKSAITHELKIGEGLKSGIYFLNVQTSTGNHVYLINKK